MDGKDKVACQIMKSFITCQSMKSLRTKSFHSNQGNRIATSLSYTEISEVSSSNNTQIRMLDTPVMEATDKVSEVATTQVLTCNLTSSKIRAKCQTKITSVHPTIKEWASTARNLIISITCSNNVAITIKEEEIEVVQCTLDMATSIDMITQTTQYIHRTVAIVDTVEEPQEDVAKVGSITAIIITTILMEMECIIPNTTNILVIKINMIEVENNLIEITQMTVVQKCIDVPKEATTNKSTKNSITINTIIKTLMTSIKFQ